MMHGPEKSDSVIVAGKPTNKVERSAAESVERRTGTKGNAGQLYTCRTQGRIAWHKVLARIRQRCVVNTRGGRSYGAGRRMVWHHRRSISRWRLPRGVGK